MRTGNNNEKHDSMMGPQREGEVKDYVETEPDLDDYGWRAIRKRSTDTIG